ncbi:MAG: hypothetical protein VYC64_17470 [Candidatus Latescibacterota bacterium]|nr:hypothetical protein [Candidatus Latescibacterota bacterium]MEE3337327.1 hypothetical protein [Candidatus Latescibacterota bacterium]
MSCRISHRRSSHLLAAFQDVPDFLDAAWLGPDDEEHRCQQITVI